MAEDRDARVDELQARLVDLQDPLGRARIHLELATLAMTDGRPEAAVRHLREALLLDRSLDRARTMLRELGAVTQIGGGSTRRRDAVKSLLGKVRRRRTS